MNPETIVLHDYFGVPGGGERLVLTLAMELDAALAYGYWSQDSYGLNEAQGLKRHDLLVKRGLPGLQTVQMVRAFRRRTDFLSDYSLAIYSGDIAPFAVDNHRRGGNIWYCHTPPRMVYDQRAFFLARQPAWRRPALQALNAWLARAYPRLASCMDAVVVNSENVRQRVQRYWHCQAQVVYPPCDTAQYQWREPEGYYLSTARLSPLKRVDLVVDAFLAMPDKQLVVTSTGPELAALQKRAAGASNIRFTGQVSDEELRRWLGGAIASIYVPVEEDFGMSPVESMAAGKPVIGVAEGGVLETVLPDVTGLLVPARPCVEDLVKAVHALPEERVRAMRSACEQRAQQFDKAAFVRGMKRVIDAL